MAYRLTSRVSINHLGKISFDTPHFTELPPYSPKRRLKIGSMCAIGVAVPSNLYENM